MGKKVICAILLFFGTLLVHAGSFPLIIKMLFGMAISFGQIFISLVFLFIGWECLKAGANYSPDWHPFLGVVLIFLSTSVFGFARQSSSIGDELSFIVLCIYGVTIVLVGGVCFFCKRPDKQT